MGKPTSNREFLEFLKKSVGISVDFELSKVETNEKISKLIFTSSTFQNASNWILLILQLMNMLPIENSST